MVITGAMIHRGSPFSHLMLPCLAFRHGGPLPLCTERVSLSFSTFRGLCTSGSRGHGNYITPISCRDYSDRSISRPKAHTGRTTTTLLKKDPTATTVIVNTNSKGGENPAAKVNAKPKKRSNPKTKAKTTSRSNAKAKPGPKKRPTKALTAQQKQRLDAKKARLKTNSEKAKQKKKVEKAKQKAKLEKAKQKEKLQKEKQKEKLENAKKREQLPTTKVKKAKALALHPPRLGERSVWQIVLSETARSPDMAKSPAHVISQEASTRYKNLSPESREVILYV